MKKTIKMKFLFLISAALVTAAILIGGYFYFQIFQKKKKEFFVGSYNFLLANTEETRVKGLSQRDFLPSDTVMLFDFQVNDKCGIWMKDMKFPIDVIWLSSDFTVIDLKENISPSTFPEVFFPASPCRYLIEAAQGFLKKSAVERGDKVLIDFDNSVLKIIKNLQQP